MLTFSLEGDLRFISHHDTVRMFQRALVRAGLPVRYTEGFNPHARLSLPLPRPVGVATACDALIVEFTRPVDQADVLSLNDALPPSVRIVDARRLGEREKVHPHMVTYRLDPGEALPADLEGRIERMLAADALPVERKHAARGGIRRMDIRPFIRDVRLDGGAVRFTVLVTDQGSVKPSEILERLGFDAAAHLHRLRRIEVRWRTNSASAIPSDKDRHDPRNEHAINDPNDRSEKDAERSETTEEQYGKDEHGPGQRCVRAGFGHDGAASG
ncbi:MAG: DUF2344 domain-containing protein [Planctomycetota bacterium]|nr:MAG: DUF2344 domain-containing protein [Planctomycetota bacterium]